MIFYICPTCKKVFNRKSNFEYHFEHRKNPCVPKEEKTLVQTDENKIYDEKKSITKTNNQNLSINEILFSNFNMQNTAEKNTCLYCNTTFTRNSSLQRHLNKDCKAKKSYEELEMLKEKLKTLATENEQLKKEMTELKHTKISNKNITNNTNSNNKINNGVINNNNNTINVQLVQFGNENIDHIDVKEALDVYLKSTGGNIISNILKLINLNEKYPQNHNICISDLSRELVKIFDGKKFIIRKFKNIKGDIMCKLIKNTHKIVDKIENDKFIKKTPDVKSKMKINNVSLKLIDGCSPEDIVREEVKEKEKLLKSEAEKNKKIKKNKKNKNDTDIENNSDVESDNDKNSVSDSDNEEEREFNLEELLRIEHLESKQPGLLEIALERLKEELYNGKIFICE